MVCLATSQIQREAWLSVPPPPFIIFLQSPSDHCHSSSTWETPLCRSKFRQEQVPLREIFTGFGKNTLPVCCSPPTPHPPPTQKSPEPKIHFQQCDASYTCLHTCMHICACTHTCVHARKHARKHSFMHAYSATEFTTIYSYNCLMRVSGFVQLKLCIHVCNCSICTTVTPHY